MIIESWYVLGAKDIAMNKAGLTLEVQTQHDIELRENLFKEVIFEWDLGP